MDDLSDFTYKVVPLYNLGRIEFSMVEITATIPLMRSLYRNTKKKVTTFIGSRNSFSDGTVTAHTARVSVADPEKPFVAASGVAQVSSTRQGWRSAPTSAAGTVVDDQELDVLTLGMSNCSRPQTGRQKEVTVQTQIRVAMNDDIEAQQPDQPMPPVLADSPAGHDSALDVIYPLSEANNGNGHRGEVSNPTC